MIGVCIPIYNTPKTYLIDLLNSLADQTCEDFKVYLQDDCSRIDYSDVIDKYSLLLDLSYVKNQKNLGMVGNWNAVLARVSEELLMFLGHDDFLAPECLEVMRAAFVDDPGLMVSCAGCKYVNFSGEEIQPKFNVNHRSKIFIEKLFYRMTCKEALDLCLKNGIAFGELSCQMFRRAAVGKKFDDAFRHAADLDNFMSTLARFPDHHVAYNAASLVVRRIHSGALTDSNYIAGYVTKEREMIFRRYAKSGFECSIDDYKVFLIACAFKDIFSFFKHRSWVVLRLALVQFPKFFFASPLAYSRLLKSILTAKNYEKR